MADTCILLGEHCIDAQRDPHSTKAHIGSSWASKPKQGQNNARHNQGVHICPDLAWVNWHRIFFCPLPKAFFLFFFLFVPPALIVQQHNHKSGPMLLILCIRPATAAVADYPRGWNLVSLCFQREPLYPFSFARHYFLLTWQTPKVQYYHHWSFFLFLSESTSSSTSTGSPVRAIGRDIPY